jgi:DNA-binding NtrC family response regulator
MARILLAETDLHVRRFVAGILSDCGHAVETCADAVEAASSLATRRIDIVVTDLVFEFGGDTPLAHDCAARGIPTLSLSGSSLVPSQPSAEPVPGLREKPFRFGYLQRVIEAVADQPGSPSSRPPQPGGAGSASDEARRA